jgi:hypothetical protein
MLIDLEYQCQHPDETHANMQAMRAHQSEKRRQECARSPGMTFHVHIVKFINFHADER